MLALCSGLFAGGLHALSGPDHLAALGPLALNEPERAAGVGARWGAGHGAGLLALAVLVLGARLALPVDAISWGAELAVGIWLVVMGAGALRVRPARQPRPTHDAIPTRRTAFLVGLLHGATGAGHVLGVLPGLGLGEGDAVSYLCGYAASAVVSMGVVGKVLGSLAMRSTPVGVAQMRRLCAAVALVVGVFWTGQALSIAL